MAMRFASFLASHCRVDWQSYVLGSSHKRQRGDVDADLRRENRPQGPEALPESTARGEYVI